MPLAIIAQPWMLISPWKASSRERCSSFLAKGAKTVLAATAPYSVVMSAVAMPDPTDEGSSRFPSMTKAGAASAMNARISRPSSWRSR